MAKFQFYGSQDTGIVEDVYDVIPILCLTSWNRSDCLEWKNLVDFDAGEYSDSANFKFIASSILRGQ